MKTWIGMGVAAIALAAVVGLAAAQTPADQPPRAHPFKIGKLDAMVFYDGGMKVPNDGKVLGVDEGPEKVAAVLKAAGVPTDALALDVNVLMVKAGARTFLFDTGLGAQGKLQASLQAASVDPASVTDIVISHGHYDHVGGLVLNGAPAFPNAKVHMSEAEWASVKATAPGQALEKVLGSKILTFKPGAKLAPGVTAVEVRGHTPGHSAVLIEDGRAKVLAIGDTAHHHVVSVREPEFTIAFDLDKPTAEASRRALLKRAADQRLTVFAPHFPYPGLGTIRPEGSGYRFVPSPAPLTSAAR